MQFLLKAQWCHVVEHAPDAGKVILLSNRFNGSLNEIQRT